MRGTHKLKLTEVRNLQKNLKEKTEKEADALIQLMDLPDFDTSQYVSAYFRFFQTLMKSNNHEQVIEKIPMQKKIDFFSKNYMAFLQTQEELLKLELPKLQQIPRAKQFTFQTHEQEKVVDNFEESSVLQIIDSFSSFVLEKNIDETLRVYQIIQEMKKHSKYKEYFNHYSINKIFLETYNTFIDGCSNHEILLQIGEYDKAIKIYLLEKENKILGEVKINLNINDGVNSIGKQMSKVVAFVESEVKQFKIKFKKQISKNEDLNASLSEWIRNLTKNFYLLIQPHVYEKDELSDILSALNIILEASSQLSTKGVTLQRQLKELIAVDLPLHISKVIEIIVDSVNQVLKQNNELYQFVYFSSIKNFSTDLSNLKPVTKDDFGEKCATCKGIILVNSFILILSTLCDDKWIFLHEGVIDILLNKVALNILNCTLHYWDYYFIYLFFQRLAVGKIRHLELFSGEPNPGLSQKLGKIKGLSEESWELFESKLLNQFWKEILIPIPGELFNFKRYGYQLQKPDLRPSTLSISIIFQLQQFFKQIQFRLSTSQFEYLTLIFFEFIIFTFEYILFWSYHSKGTNDKVFILYGKQEKLLKKVKEFNFLEIEQIKQENILKLSKLNKFGFLKFVFQVYFLTDIIKIITRVKKIECEQFLSRLSKILAKDQKIDVIDTSRAQFQQILSKMVKIYQQKPQLMQNYLTDRKKG